MLRELSKEIRETNLDPIMQLNLYTHDEKFYDSMTLGCVGCVSVEFMACDLSLHSSVIRE